MRIGTVAPNPVLSGLRYFREECETHLYERECPAGVCKELLTYTIDNSICTAVAEYVLGNVLSMLL